METPSTTAPVSTPTAPSAPSSPAAAPAAKTQMNARDFRAKVMSTPQADSSQPNASDFADGFAPGEGPDAEEPADIEAEGLDIEQPHDDGEEPVDDAWLEELRDYKEVHGLSAKELLSALQAGNIPESLLDKLMIELKDGDETWTASIAEAKNGAMRSARFTKKMTALANERNAFAQERTQFGAERDQLVGMITNWKADPLALLNGMRKLGMPIEDAARAYAEELHQLEQMGPGAREMFLEKQKLAAELADLKQRQAWEQDQTQKTNAQQKAEAQKQQDANNVQFVQQNAMGMFEKVGLKMTKGSWGSFMRHLDAHWSAVGQLSHDVVREAVMATKEEVDGVVADHKAGIVAPKKLAARPLDGGAPKVTAPGARPKSISSKEFRKRLRGD